MPDDSQKYVIITPARDEELFIEKTIESAANQSYLPEEWIIVYDGSSDRTGAIAESFADKFRFLRVVNRKDRGRREAGSGVTEAVYSGIELLQIKDWDFLVKLDSDLEFGSDYFERCLSEFATDPLKELAAA